MAKRHPEYWIELSITKRELQYAAKRARVRITWLPDGGWDILEDDDFDKLQEFIIKAFMRA